MYGASVAFCPKRPRLLRCVHRVPDHSPKRKSSNREHRGRCCVGRGVQNVIHFPTLRGASPSPLNCRPLTHAQRSVACEISPITTTRRHINSLFVKAGSMTTTTPPAPPGNCLSLAFCHLAAHCGSKSVTNRTISCLVLDRLSPGMENRYRRSRQGDTQG